MLGNSAYRLLMRWQDSLSVVDIAAYRGRQIEARPDPKYRGHRAPDFAPGTVLKTYAISDGFLVELMDEIVMITPRGAYSLLRERAARIRTFSQARRYQDAILVVEENSVSLIGFFETSDLL